MNEDRFNMDIRKFLKTVGVTSQREIEQAVRAALATGKLTDASVLKPRIVAHPRDRARSRDRW